MVTSPPCEIDRLQIVEDVGNERDRWFRTVREDQLAVAVDSVEPCDCDDAHDESGIVKSFDKHWLYQCHRCGGFFWVHDAIGDYGDPRLDYV